jgi:hypothetical protein
LLKKVLMPLPSHDFDPTEAAVAWRVIRDAGHQVVFASPEDFRDLARGSVGLLENTV